MNQWARAKQCHSGQCTTAHLLAPNTARARPRGFILLTWKIGLITLSLLLLTGLEQRRLQGLQTQQQQQFYLQALTQSLSALAIAPYLSWQPASRQWQCQDVEQHQLCLRQRIPHPDLALLRVAPLKPTLADAVTLYHFVKQPAVVHTAALHSESIQQSTVSLLWVAGGWLDSCPEKEVSLCQ